MSEVITADTEAKKLIATIKELCCKFGEEAYLLSKDGGDAKRYTSLSNKFREDLAVIIESIK